MCWQAGGEDQDSVKRDASAHCSVCKGEGWHWGWNEYQEPVMLRCPCVDRNRMGAARDTTVSAMGAYD